MIKTLSAAVSLFAFVFVAAPAARAATEWKVDAVHSNVQFKVKHLVVSTVTGAFKDFGGTIEFDPAKPAAAKVRAYAKVDSIDTGNGDRDKHLKSPDFFDAAKYPEIKFESGKVTSDGGDKYTVEGSLTMRGVTKPVKLDVTFGGAGKNPQGNDVAGFEAVGKISRKDFGIVWNKALETGGVAVGDEVTMLINVEANRPAAKAPAKKK